MIGRKDEAEVIIRLDQLEQKTHICVSAWPSMARKMNKLYGPSLDNGDSRSQRWTLPMKIVSFRRVLDAATRAKRSIAASERLSDTQFGGKLRKSKESTQG